MKKPHLDIHQHAKEHHEAQIRLADLVKRYNPKKEKVGKLFVGTFLLVLVTLLLFRNWGNIAEALRPEPRPPAEVVRTHGIKTGVSSVYRIDEQVSRSERDLMASVPTNGSTTSALVNSAFGSERGEKPAATEAALKNSVWLTNYLSTGQHLTKLEQKQARALQKSILSTYYLGEKTIDINSTLQTDSKLLSQIKNALSVDLFAYLNQSVNRSDSLDEYMNLLNALLSKTNERIADLTYKIDFLSTNFQAKEQEIQLSEGTFFQNLQIFDGPNAEEELGQFIGLQEAQVEIRAKLGAYRSLRDYYEFFQPRLENLITAIRANRAPLIAGVKVVEIQDMSLPLIIRNN